MAAPPDPDKLVRRQAGAYRTADDRFEVREADVGWFLVDTEQANEFGQELLHGPFETLKAVRAALPGARKTTPIPRRAARAPKGRSKKREEPQAPPSWIDRLPPPDAKEARALIRALEREDMGAEEAEALVRRDREGLEPAIAMRRIERRLDALLDKAGADERALARRILRLLSSDGQRRADGLPGWTLVELGPEDEPPNRRIILED